MAIISVRFSNSLERKTALVDSALTVAEAFDQAGVAREGMVLFNGTALTAQEINGISMDELGVRDGGFITSTQPKADAYDIKVLDGVAVLKSEFKYDDWKKVSPQYIYEDVPGGDPRFVVMAGREGSISPRGIVFERSGDDAKVRFEVSTIEPAEDILDRFGGVLNALDTIEAGLIEDLEEIEIERDCIRNNITIC